MKKLLTVISATLALNFLALAAGIAYLYKSGKLDKQKIHTIRQMVFAPATQPAATQPSRDPTTQPSLKLEELLAKVSGRTSSEQVEFMQRTFDSQMAILDRRMRDMLELKAQAERARKEADDKLANLAREQKNLASAKQAQEALLSDQGFQDTLNLYTTMPAKQAKTIFMTMDDSAMINYLRAMEPRVATKIVKEFKSPEEMQRIGLVMEKMRQAQAAADK